VPTAFPTPAPVCQGTLDLMLAIDQSGSIRAQNFDMMKQGLVEMVDAFTFNGESNAKVGGVKFSTGTVKVFEGLSSNKAEVSRKIDQMSYEGGWTYTHSGLRVAAQELEDHGREGVAKVIVVVTDGECKTGSNDHCDGEVQQTATEIKTSGVVVNGRRHPVTIISVGLGKAVNDAALTRELEQMASDERDVLIAERFEDFNSIAAKIVSLACRDTETTAVTTAPAVASGLVCGSYDSSDCKSEYNNGKNNGNLGNFYSRCRTEGGSQPLRNRCSLCCTGENAPATSAATAPTTPPTAAPTHTSASGFCSWNGCSSNGGSSWCSASEGRCTGNCNGQWCPATPTNPAPAPTPATTFRFDKKQEKKNKSIRCPAEGDCTIICAGEQSCEKAKIYPPTAAGYAFTLKCSGKQACKDLSNGGVTCATHGDCDVECSGEQACEKVDFKAPTTAGVLALTCSGKQACDSSEVAGPEDGHAKVSVTCKGKEEACKNVEIHSWNQRRGVDFDVNCASGVKKVCEDVKSCNIKGKKCDKIDNRRRLRGLMA
jgi:uncharacterized protein YegL